MVRSAAYKADIRLTNGAPHLISFTNVRRNTQHHYNIVRAANNLAKKMRNEVAHAVMRYTGWTFNQAIERVRGIVTGVSNGSSVGEDVDDLNVFGTARVGDGQVLLDILEHIQQSNSTVDFYDIEWNYWITPTSLVLGGSQNITRPKWHTSAAFSQTWKGYKDDEGDISCAAFAICWSLYSNFD